LCFLIGLEREEHRAAGQRYSFGGPGATARLSGIVEKLNGGLALSSTGTFACVVL